MVGVTWKDGAGGPQTLSKSPHISTIRSADQRHCIPHHPPKPQPREEKVPGDLGAPTLWRELGILRTHGGGGGGGGGRIFW